MTSWIPSDAHLSADGLPGVVRSYSAQTLGHGRLGVSLGLRGHVDDKMARHRRFLYYQGPADSLPDTTQIGELQSGSVRFNVSMGLSDYFDMALSLPVHVDLLPENLDTEELSGSGIGDLSLAAKLQYPPYKHSHVFDMAFWGGITFPSGSSNEGFLPKEVYYIPEDSTEKTPFFTAQKHTVAAMMLWTFDPSYLSPKVPLRFHANYGLLSTEKESLDNQFMLNLAAEWFPTPFLTLFTEFTGQTRLEQFQSGFNIGEDPLFLSFGFSLDTPNGVFFTFAFDKGLSKRTYNSMLWGNSAGEHYRYETKSVYDWGISINVGYSAFVVPQDRDGDGIEDDRDVCPDDPEDKDGFEDHDGCPDPDNDGDGIPDVKDRCPLEAEDRDGYEDSDGCPDLDNDSDGIPDQKDRCPDDAEDMDGFEDEDGCPDLDNDKDGVPDSTDQCPNDPEDLDGFEDEDGCPDLDNDKDGIPDKEDKCPNEPETFNGFQDEDGCPDVADVKEPGKQVVLHGVNFRTGSADLLPESFPKLNEVVSQLKAYPDVVIEIRGHTDNIGTDARNVELSQERADSVRDYLLSQGANPAQVNAKGMGEAYPIATNRTAAGRQQNRRIEMYRLK